jgi:biotin carboxyl carrier protein
MPFEGGKSIADLAGVQQVERGNSTSFCDLTPRHEGVSVAACGTRQAVAIAPLAAANPVPVLPTSKPIPSKAPPDGETRLVAPMPGVIVLCEKSIGEDVQRGEAVLILEAMKMENLITAPSPGKVVSILCKEGQRVARGEVLALIGSSGFAETCVPGKGDSK